MTSSVLFFNPALYILIPAAFLAGSIPFGLVFTRSKGIDLRSTGSRNIGATNVLRTAGKLPALLTLLADALKGALPVMACNFIVSGSGYIDGNPEFLAQAKIFWGGLTGFTAVAGHIFSVFLSFKGGKGVATGLGAVAAYSPASAVVMVVIWVGVAAVTKYSSLAAIVSASLLPIVFAFVDYSRVRITFGVLMAALIVYRHKENIKRIIEGNESKIGNRAES